MSFLEAYAVAAAVVVGMMTLLWLVSLAVRDSSIVDIFWGCGFVVVAATYALLTDGYVGRQLLVVSLVAIWGLRLSLHIGVRNWGTGEDARYQTWRRTHGQSYWWVSFFRVFLLQGVLLWLISAPLLAAQVSGDPNGFQPLDFIGSAVWLIGFAFEAIGDYQLVRFKRAPENDGSVMRSGLWAYTRHPNYFGDATVWWGLFIIAATTPNGYWTVFGPVIMTFLLLRVSGVAMLERSLGTAKPGYREYVESTSAFVPWIPKHKPEPEMRAPSERPE